MQKKINSPQSFVDYHRENGTIFQIRQFFVEFHKALKYDYQIDFMDFFLGLCKRHTEFIIEQSKLVEYGIITANTFSKAERCIVTNRKLKKDIEYKIIKVPGDGKFGRDEVDAFVLTPIGFKLCLGGSIKTDIYLRYFILLEMVFCYYSEYELTMKESELRLLRKELQESRKEAQESRKENERNFRNLNYKLDDMNEFAHEVSGRSVPIKPNSLNSHCFLLLQSKSNDHVFKFIRTLKGDVNNIERKNSKDYYISMKEYSPNPIELCIRVKNRVDEFNLKRTKDLKRFEDEGDPNKLDDESIESFHIKFHSINFFVGENCEIEDFISLVRETNKEKYQEVEKKNN